MTYGHRGTPWAYVITLFRLSVIEVFRLDITTNMVPHYREWTLVSLSSESGVLFVTSQFSVRVDQKMQLAGYT